MLFIIKTTLSLFFIMPLVFIIGNYLSVKFKWLQITHFDRAVRLLFTGNTVTKSKNSFSSFSALAAVIGGNLGTGNIAGIAIALSMGGPGALFWMWIMALLGAILKFTGTFLGVNYREKLGHNFVGGPMYYIANGLNKPGLAKVFCLLTIFASFSVGNLVQINSITLPLVAANIDPVWAGFLLAGIVGIILFKGVGTFAKLSATLVPIMTVFYLGASLIILCQHLEGCLQAFYLILKSAFSPTSLAGGVIGFSVIDAIRVGFDRGLFATDAGVGLAPILHAGVNCTGDKRQTAFEQGLISIVAPMIVMLICMVTGLVLMVTGVWQLPGVESTNACILAFQIGLQGNAYGAIVLLTLTLFALTTMLTWSHCGEQSILFLTKNKKIMRYYKLMFILLVPLGTLFQVQTVWIIADIALNGMLLINLFAVFLLSKPVSLNLNNYMLKLE